jgi:2-oxoglutarate ferredoxin oxidoreductase subunit alpha
MPELFNLCDKAQCPGLVLIDLLIGEGRFSFDPDDLDMHPNINRGELITEGTLSGETYHYTG